ncbi:hypothetical protein [Helicobacter cappadocius]|uniref:Lipoprotein n=1 Tax=Helicobacter cappadocius TaxID=3063998 RepID=A0AA90Q322_9HELI|nr:MULTISPECIES: hypothetical protein [unclassified Helicobacter]MDO7253337.1 hypothetical protein [Helicobacter sp. faydin-H75]MDP2539233.1 hypothetical protein [Helicobacter sp. faydin-H76]
MKFSYLSVCILIFSGCSTTFPPNSTNYSLLSTNKVEIPNIKTSPIPVEGESCFATLLSHSKEKVNSTMNQAIANAIENGKKRGFEGDFLIDTEITQTDKSGFIDSTCFKVRGKLATIQKK